MAIVIGSNRPNRIGDMLALCLLHAAAHLSDLTYELVDLAEVDLPFLDEPYPPARGQYEHEHTREWSRTVSAYSAYVFVLPQYNWGYPAVLKNALDFLYHEWGDKPAGIVTYGTHGGGKAADQIRLVLLGLHMQPVERDIRVCVRPDDVDSTGQLLDADVTMAPYLPEVVDLDAAIAAALQTGRNDTAGRIT